MKLWLINLTMIMHTLLRITSIVFLQRYPVHKQEGLPTLEVNIKGDAYVWASLFEVDT